MFYEYSISIKISFLRDVLKETTFAVRGGGVDKFPVDLNLNILKTLTKTDLNLK